MPSAITVVPESLTPGGRLSPWQEGAEFTFTPLELALAVPVGAFCTWYYTRKHWFANNVLGLAFRWGLGVGLGT